MHGCGHDGPVGAQRCVAVDIADIIRVYGPAPRQLHSLSHEQLAALRDIERCAGQLAIRQPPLRNLGRPTSNR